MPQAEDNVSQIWLPAGEPHERPSIFAKAVRPIQTLYAVIKRAINADEWYTRNAYDELEEFQYPTLTANVTLVFQHRPVKVVWLLNDPTSSVDLVVVWNQGSNGVAALGGIPASKAIHLQPGEFRQFFIPTNSLTFAAKDGTTSIVARITVGW